MAFVLLDLKQQSLCLCVACVITLYDTFVSAGLGVSKTKLLEQPIPACYLKLQEKVRELSVQCRNDNNPPVIKETMFRDFTKEIIANPRELNQAVTFLHENGVYNFYVHF